MADNNQCITFRQWKARYPFMHSCALALCTFFSIFHSFQVGLFSCCTIFVLHSFFVARWSSCINSMLDFFFLNVVFFRVALFRCCTFFLVAIFLGWNFFVLDLFHLVLFSCFTFLRVALFSCCTFFCFASFCTHFMLNFFCITLFFILHFF